MIKWTRASRLSLKISLWEEPAERPEGSSPPPASGSTSPRHCPTVIGDSETQECETVWETGRDSHGRQSETVMGDRERQSWETVRDSHGRQRETVMGDRERQSASPIPAPGWEMGDSERQSGSTPPRHCQSRGICLGVHHLSKNLWPLMLDRPVEYHAVTRGACHRGIIKVLSGRSSHPRLARPPPATGHDRYRVLS